MLSNIIFKKHKREVASLGVCSVTGNKNKYFANFILLNCLRNPMKKHCYPYSMHEEPSKWQN